MKKILLITLVLTGVTAFAANTPDINEKVLKSFKETFLNATNVVWYEEGDEFQANFLQASIIVKANFDVDGNLLSTIRYYSEEHLPAKVLSRLRKTYPGKTIFGVTEINTDDEIAYYVKLVDDKFWYTVKSDSWGWLVLREKYRKA